MPYRFSRCLCLATDDHDRAVRFYGELLGLEAVNTSAESVEFRAGQNRLFVDRADAHGGAYGMVMELEVPDLEAARSELEAAGCEAVRWEGKGKDCYIRDPFGGIFNLWESSE